MSLATYSGKLKVFKSNEDYSLSASVSLSNEKQAFGRVTWSGDGKWLAAAPTNSAPLPIVRYKENQLKPVKYVTLSNIKSACFFNLTNRSIVIGNETGEIFIWDIKDKTVSTKVDSKSNYSIDHVSMNLDDNYLASGSHTTADVYLHGLKTNKTVSKFSIPGSAHTSSLCFCMCKRNYLGACSFESTVCVWDISRSEEVFKKLNCHTGSCTDISFSPINSSFLASVSLTETLKLFDLRQKNIILNVKLDRALTCVDIFARGDTVAVGTSNGSVIIYDLRATKISKSFQADNEAVLSLKVESVKQPESYREIEMESVQALETSGDLFELTVCDILSPIVPSMKSTSVKVKTHHSTPKVEDLTYPYNDSVLNVISTLSEIDNNNSMLSPVIHKEASRSVHQDSPMNNTSQFAQNFIKTSSFEENKANEDIKPHLPPITPEAHCGNFINMEVINEIRSLRCEINEMRTELNVMKRDNENRFEALKEILVDQIKEEIFRGNCQTKLDHIFHKMKIDDLNAMNEERHEKLIREFYLNSLRFSVVRDSIEDLKKSLDIN